MKAVPFDYARAHSIDEACALLAEDEDARIIAGGQTLVPMLAMRLARPSRLIDILRIPGLAGIREVDGAIAIGATTRQVEVERNAVVAARLPLLAKAMPWVGHQATRNRGTVGGSIANADPAAEIPLIAVTLGAEIVVRASGSSESLPAEAFLRGPMMTALPPAACVVETRWPVWTESRIGVGFHEVSTRRSDFAFVAAAAQVAVDPDGLCTRCAVGLGGAGDRPIRLAGAAEALVGSALRDSEIRAAVAMVTAGLETMSDQHASAEYRLRVARTLAARALAQARDAALHAREGRP
jgi:carbon-monoxide dehydrogenase medium subunit